MGSDCCKNQNLPEKLKIFINNNWLTLPLIPKTYKDLEIGIDVIARDTYPFYDPLDYYISVYIVPKSGKTMLLHNKTTFKKALKESKGKSMNIRVEKEK